MTTFRAFPRHLKPLTGKGLVTCALSGYLRRPEDIVVIDGVPTAKDRADHYGAFGYTHPQDVAQPEIGGDPRPVDYGGELQAFTKQDLKISDQEIEAAIRENRAPRPDTIAPPVVPQVQPQPNQLVTSDGLPFFTSDGLAFIVAEVQPNQLVTSDGLPFFTSDGLAFITAEQGV